MVLWRSVRRWQWALAVFLGAVGFAAVLQLRAGLALRRAVELPTVRVRELAVLVRQQEDALAALQAEVEVLRRTLAEYEAAAAQGRLSADTLAREVRAYELVLGLVPVQGPGVWVRVDDSRPGSGVLPASVEAADLAGLVNELWAAGAEAVAVNGRRILASTGFRQDSAGLSAGVFRLRPPYEILAIGNPEAMLAALNLRGGFVDGLRSVGLTVEVQARSAITLPSYRGPLGFRHAVPVAP
jgi:uncharacterized protein YlxW (UPF0749 family)